MKLIFGSTFSYETSIQNGEYISAGIPASVFIIVMAMRLYLGYRNKVKFSNILTHMSSDARRNVCYHNNIYCPTTTTNCILNDSNGIF